MVYNPKKTFVAIPCPSSPSSPKTWMFSSPCTFLRVFPGGAPGPFLNEQKAIQRWHCTFPSLKGPTGILNVEGSFNLWPALLNMHSHFPEVLVFNNMLLLLYKDNEPAASVGCSLWMSSVNGDDLRGPFRTLPHRLLL